MSTGAILSSGLGSFGNIATILTDGLSTATGLPQPPLTGTQYTDQTVIYSGTGLSLQQGAIPAVAIGDVLVTPLTTTPSGYTIQVNNDGTIVVYAGGDTSRQSFLYSRYGILTNLTDGPAECWINETPPIWALAITIPPPRGTPPLYLGMPITPIVLNPGYVASPWGDPLTFSLASGTLPTGLSLSPDGVISGTPTSVGTFTFTINAADLIPENTVSPLNSITVAIVALTQPAAIVQWENNALNLVSWFSGSYLLYNGMAPGTFGKYIGLTVSSTGSIYQLNALDMDYKLRARWN